MTRAKIFWSGRSQAVHRPREFRVSGDEVRIRRSGATLILEPIAEDWAWLDTLPDVIDDDFVTAVSESMNQQERPGLDFFK